MDRFLYSATKRTKAPTRPASLKTKLEQVHICEICFLLCSQLAGGAGKLSSSNREEQA